MGYLKNTIKGISWIGGLRVSTRAIGYLRIAILARILTPEQFGVFGVGALILAFLEVFTETGINVFLIQEEKEIDDYLNTAWIVSIIRGIVIALLVLLTASFISSFFKSPESYQILILIGLVPLIRGFINPAIVKLRKELEFGKVFSIGFSIYLLDSIVAIVVALATKSAISFVWGLLAGVFLEVLISHLFVKPRPKLLFNKLRAVKIIKRGKWVTLSGIFNYLSQQGDDAVVAKIINTASLGLYQASYKISTLPLTEITQVAAKVTFPVYAKIAGDLQRLKKAFLKVTLGTSLLIIPFGLVLFTFPEEIVKLLLGNQWIQAAPVLRVLAIFGIGRALIAIPNVLFLSLKKQKIAASLQFIRFTALAVTIVPLTIKYGVIGAGYSSIISVIFASPFVIYSLYKVFQNDKV